MKDEGGYAVMEVFLVGLLLLVPLIWMLIAASSLHRTALASASAVREAGLVASRALTASDAQGRARAAVARALSERGVDPAGSRMSLAWATERDAAVNVELEIPVHVLVVPFVGRPMGPVVWVKARHLARIDPYRSLDA